MQINSKLHSKSYDKPLLINYNATGDTHSLNGPPSLELVTVLFSMWSGSWGMGRVCEGCDKSTRKIRRIGLQPVFSGKPGMISRDQFVCPVPSFSKMKEIE